MDQGARPGTAVRTRNHTFDLLRILFATGVLLAHAPELTDGDRSRELLSRFLHTPFDFGSLGVDGFFLLSGYLIVKSWEFEPRLMNFFRKRLLRIVPGYVIAALFATLVIGWIAPGVPSFFRHLGARFLFSIVRLGNLSTPPVFPGMPFAIVNGSLWTIPYELRCYITVALAGMCGLLRRPALWLGTTVLLFLPMCVHPLPWQSAWHKLYYVTGEPRDIARLGSAFFIGGCFYLFRSRIPFRPLFAALAVAVLVAVAVLRADFIEPATVLLGGYLMFYFCATFQIAWMTRVPDISYGVYLYGGPVESLWIWYHRSASPWATFAASAVIVYALGWASWHFVERPMLSLKPRPSAALPSG